jgi:hypothetical protein
VRPAAVQARIDRFIFELVELQRPRIRRLLGELLDYYLRYELTRELTSHALAFEAWKVARDATQVRDAITIAEEAGPDDECVATRVEINTALRRVCFEEVRGARLEAAEIDRLAQEDAK